MKLGKLLGALRADQRGNVLMIFGFSLIPMVFATGMGIDYARAMKSQTKLNAAADAAALSAVSQAMMTKSNNEACSTARDMFEAQANGLSGVVVDWAQLEITIRDGNGAILDCGDTSNPAVGAQASQSRTVTVSYSATSSNAFAGILGMATLPLSGASDTYASVAPNINFYIALDTSLSMALPTTKDGIDDMYKATGCTFACHSNKLEIYVQNGTGHINRLIADSTRFDLNKGNYGTGSVNGPCTQWGYGGYCTKHTIYNYTKIDSTGRYVFDDKPANGAPETCKVDNFDKCVYNPTPSTQGTYADSYWYALNKGIRLRVTDQKFAVQDLMDLAATYSQTNEAVYQAALYTFDHANHGTQGVTRVSALNSNLSAVKAAAENANLTILNDIDGNGCPKTGCSGSNTYLYTSFKSIMTAVSPGGAFPIPNPGNGTKTAGDTPQAFLFLVTDGMSDEFICNASNSCTSGRTRSAMQEAQIAQCNALKNRKVKVAILYTEYTYESIQEDELGQRTLAKNAIQGLNGQKSIEQALTECASPGLMYKVKTDESISNALQSLFSKALAAARIIR